MTTNGPLTWIKDETDPRLRSWEEFYRNRWQHDKVVRSTHGVNCTGGCTWQIYVKDGIVTWEMQGLDYPSLESGLPPTTENPPGGRDHQGARPRGVDSPGRSRPHRLRRGRLLAHPERRSFKIYRGPIDVDSPGLSS